MRTDWKTCFSGQAYGPICGYLGGGGTWYYDGCSDVWTRSYGFGVRRGSGYGHEWCNGNGSGVGNDGEYGRGGGDGDGGGLSSSHGTGNGSGTI